MSFLELVSGELKLKSSLMSDEDLRDGDCESLLSSLKIEACGGSLLVGEFGKKLKEDNLVSEGLVESKLKFCDWLLSSGGLVFGELKLKLDSLFSPDFIKENPENMLSLVSVCPFPSPDSLIPLRLPKPKPNEEAPLSMN